MLRETPQIPKNHLPESVRKQGLLCHLIQIQPLAAYYQTFCFAPG